MEVTNAQKHAALRFHFTWESVRASRVTRSDTRQERAHSVEQHRNAFSSRQSLVQMNTVADGLASLSFREVEQKERKKKRDSGYRKKAKGRRQFSMSAKWWILQRRFHKSISPYSETQRKYSTALELSLLTNSPVWTKLLWQSKKCKKDFTLFALNISPWLFSLSISLHDTFINITSFQSNVHS